MRASVVGPGGEERAHPSVWSLRSFGMTCGLIHSQSESLCGYLLLLRGRIRVPSMSARVAGGISSAHKECRGSSGAPNAATFVEGAGERETKWPQPLPGPRLASHAPWEGAGGRKRGASLVWLVSGVSAGCFGRATGGRSSSVPVRSRTGERRRLFSEAVGGQW